MNSLPQRLAGTRIGRLAVFENQCSVDEDVLHAAGWSHRAENHDIGGNTLSQTAAFSHAESRRRQACNLLDDALERGRFVVTQKLGERNGRRGVLQQAAEYRAGFRV